MKTKRKPPTIKEIEREFDEMPPSLSEEIKQFYRQKIKQILDYLEGVVPSEDPNRCYISRFGKGYDAAVRNTNAKIAEIRKT